MSKIRFQVCYCSGEDVDYPADELNTHSPHTKGWQSPRFCDYPQEIGLEMEEPSHITRLQILSHQSKIASKIELFVGDGPTYYQARFERLGYLSLNNNQRSNYQARELKSVYLDTRGRYIRLLVHRCYINKYNLFNQVGVIAINIIGTPGLTDGARVGGERHGPAGGGPITATKKPSAMDDISFDMNFDSETATRIREIAAAKERAVQAEDYDTAKRLKAAEAELKAIGGQIAELEVAKRQAVQLEDYDRAKSLKMEIDVLRGDIYAKLEPYLDLAGPSGGMGEGPAGHGVGARVPLGHHPQHSGANSNYDDDPVPAHRVRQAAGLGHDSGDEDSLPYDQRSPLSARRPRSREIKPGAASSSPQRGGASEEEEVDNGTEHKGPAGWHGDGPHPLEGIPNYEELPSPEPLGKTSGEAADLQAMTALFGEYIVRCLFSKHWTLRDAAISKIRMQVLTLSPLEALHAIVLTLKLGLDDKIAQVFMSSLALLETMLGACDRAGLKRPQVGPSMEQVATLLILKLGDGQARIREAALGALINLSRSPCVGPSSLSAYALRKLPKKQAAAWRPIQGRLQLLKKLVEETSLSPGSGLTADSVMSFAKDVNAFVHSSGEVRDAARELTVAVYEVIGTKVKRYIEPILRRKQLDEYEDAFQKVTPGTGSGGIEEHPHNDHGPSSKHHQAAAAASPKSGRGGGMGGGRAAAAPTGNKSPLSPKTKNNLQQQQEDDVNDDDEALADLTCDFCGKYDPTFTEDKLDLHYYTECPLLIKCKECGQVVEIVMLSEHLLQECEVGQREYEECPKSGLAVKKTEMKTWKESPSYKAKPAGADMIRCPLCFMDIKSTEEGKKLHYTKKCVANKRKLPTAASSKK